MQQVGTSGQQVLKQIEQKRQSAPGSEVSRETTPKALTIKDDAAGRSRMGEALVILYDGMKAYGMEPEQLENVTKLYNFVLADYPIDKITAAMAYYSRKFRDFPAPADIAQIIDRGNKPPLEKAVYVSLCKKEASHRTSDEWAYIRDYEDFMLNG